MAGRIIALPGKARGRQHRSVGATHIEQADALDCYGHWPAPTMIHVDGPYGIGGFPGDPMSYDQLPEAYYHHIAAWSKAAKPSTTLWFWGTELGWATVHPLLDQAGWDYQELNVWNKGLSGCHRSVRALHQEGLPRGSHGREAADKAMGSVRMGAVGRSALPCQRSLRSQERGYKEISHQRRALVFSACRDDDVYGSLSGRARAKNRTPLFLFGRHVALDGRAVAFAAIQVAS